MKTLILTGSPRKKGHTAELTEYLAARLDGEVEILSLDHRTDIMPCRDCRYCFTHRACCIQDPMQEIYQKLDEADRILFAAPVYFYNIPGSMKVVLDRLQVCWAAAVRGDRPSADKKGGIILVGGAPESPRQFDGAIQTLRYMLEDLGAACTDVVTMGGSDKAGLSDRPDIQHALETLAQKLKA
ncbi:MAG: flavodoxin family protein [Lachnospiraceae bacterium]|nr:flavodoxin family protein [Lachnospiraceae bacterium]